MLKVGIIERMDWRPITYEDTARRDQAARSQTQKMLVSSDRRLMVITSNLEAVPLLKKMYAMLLMAKPLVIKPTIADKVRTCFMKSNDRPIHKRSASEDIAVFHFSERIMLLLNLLAIAFVKN